MQKKLILFTIFFLIILYISRECNLYYLISIPFLVIFILTKIKNSLLKFEFNISKSNLLILGSYLILASLFIIIYSLMMQSIIGDSVFDNNQNISLLPLFLICTTSILEEIVYRAYFLDKLLKEKSKIASVLILSLHFSIVHIFTDTGLLYAFVFSILLSLLYIKTKSLFNTIILHLYCNFFALCLLQYFINLT